MKRGEDRAEKSVAKASAKAVLNQPFGDEKETRLLSEEELVEIEEQYPEGMALVQVIEAFETRSVRLSEATFRKYVQLGLLTRSKRVGRKGKHQGSLGVYPVSTVRRINEIKRMMSANYTIEEILRSFLRFKDSIETIDVETVKLLDGFESEIQSGAFEPERRKGLLRELSAVRKLASEVTQRIESLERQIVSPLERAARERAFGTGSAGGAEDLL